MRQKVFPRTVSAGVPYAVDSVTSRRRFAAALTSSNVAMEFGPLAATVAETWSLGRTRCAETVVVVAASDGSVSMTPSRLPYRGVPAARDTRRRTGDGCEVRVRAATRRPGAAGAGVMMTSRTTGSRTPFCGAVPVGSAVGHVGACGRARHVVGPRRHPTGRPGGRRGHGAARCSRGQASSTLFELRNLVRSRCSRQVFGLVHARGELDVGRAGRRVGHLPSRSTPS